MKNIIDNINILSGFMSSEDVNQEVNFAEERGEYPPTELDYGTPFDEGDER